MASPWVEAGPGRKRCTIHDITFVLPDACSACDHVAVQVEHDDGIDAIPHAPEGCKSTLDHERDFTLLARDLEYAGRQFLAKKGDVEEAQVHALKNLADVALKARRAAAELAAVRERRARVNARERRIQERARRVGAGN